MSDVVNFVGDIGKTAVGFGDKMNDAFGITRAFDPGKDERGRAQARDDRAQALWESALPRDQFGNPIVQAANDEAFSLDAPSFGYGEDDLRRYGETQPLLTADQDMFQATGDSAFGGIDTSGTSAFADGTSAFGDLSLDDSAVAGQKQGEEYFQNLVRSGGRDAAAEADYARRAADAEQRRRAAGEAAVQRLETMGRGGSVAELLAQVGAANGSASDQYQSGMGANALAQGRRDAAAGTAAELARARGDQQFSADATQAAGVDAFGNTRAAGVDAYDNARRADQMTQAGGQDAWSQWQQTTNAGISAANTDRRQGALEKNWQRGNETSDRNTDLQNQRAWWQGPGQGQAKFDRQQQVLAGATGQLNSSATGLRNDGAAQPSPFGFVGDLFSGVGKMMGGG